MRAVIQRVRHASVVIDQKEERKIEAGLLVLLGITHNDTEKDADWICGKIARMRIFADAAGQMNLALTETGGEILLISQFTLHASSKKGNRPSFIDAARPETALPLYHKSIEILQSLLPGKITTGEFGADMQVNLTNDGPVTIIIDSVNPE
jgi:D-tyrosyl-tRNA(Tyr) deacylase